MENSFVVRKCTATHAAACMRYVCPQERTIGVHISFDALEIQLQFSISQLRTDVYVYGVIKAGCIARVL